MNRLTAVRAGSFAIPFFDLLKVESKETQDMVILKQILDVIIKLQPEEGFGEGQHGQYKNWYATMTSAQPQSSKHAQYAERNDEIYKLIKMSPSTQTHIVIPLLAKLFTNKLLIQSENLGDFFHRSLAFAL